MKPWKAFAIAATELLSDGKPSSPAQLQPQELRREAVLKPCRNLSLHTVVESNLAEKEVCYLLLPKSSPTLEGHSLAASDLLERELFFLLQVKTGDGLECVAALLDPSLAAIGRH